MPNLGMGKSYSFNMKIIKSKVTKKAPGNYALGSLNNNKFTVKYVGRSDSDLGAELLNRVNTHVGKEYSHFKFSYAVNPKQAFEKECRNFHEFGETKKLDNKNHPDKPENTKYKCPICGI